MNETKGIACAGKPACVRFWERVVRVIICLLYHAGCAMLHGGTILLGDDTPMSIGDLTGIVVGLATIYFLWQQNQIFKQQNQIFAVQAGRHNMPPESAPHRLGRYWPMMAMALMTLGTWAAFGYGIYARSHQELSEFDAPQEAALSSYGVLNNSCYMTVNGKALMSRHSGYKLAIGCFVYDGRQDILDAPNLQVSNLYDVKEGAIKMVSVWGDAFNRHATEIHAAAIWVALLNVPDGVAITQFTTLRAARALGVKIPDVVATGRGQP